MEIPALIFKELIKRGYSLEGNTRVWNIADSKLWYLTPDQAQAYLDLEESKEYKSYVTKKNYDIMKDHIEEIVKSLDGVGAINVIDLGCGDGKKAAFLINLLKNKFKIRYCPIDISSYMVEKAIETFEKSKIAEIVQFQYNISDFDNLVNFAPLLRKDEYKKSLFLLLGGTMGNFDVNELLYEIRMAMKEGDVLLIANGIKNKRWMKRVKTATVDDNANNFFVHVPLLLGLKKGDLEFGVRFENKRVEYYYTVKRDCEISLQDKKVQFQAGDQIIVAYAYKLDKDELKSYLNMHFDDVTIKTIDDESYCLCLCKK